MQTQDTPRSAPPAGTIAVAVVVVAVLLAGLVALLSRPGYTSEAQLFVSGSAQGQGGGPARQRVESYAALAQSRQVAQRVDRSLDLTGSPADLQGRISAEAVPSTLLVRLQVTAASPKAAQRIARAVVGELRSLSGTIGGASGDSGIRAATGPSLPRERGSRDLPQHLLAGLLIGLVLAGLVRLALALRPRRLGSRDELAATLGVPVLGEVTLDPGGMLSRPGEPGAGFAELGGSVRYLGIDADGPLLVVTSAAEPADGVDTAIALARTLERTAAPVLLVDADLRGGGVAARLGLAEQEGLGSALLGDTELDAAVQVDPGGSLAVLPAGPPPPNPDELVGSAALRALLTRARATYRTVVLAAPSPSASGDAARLAALADATLLVVRREQGSTRTARSALGRTRAAGGAVAGVVVVSSTATEPEAPAPSDASAPAAPAVWETVGATPSAPLVDPDATAPFDAAAFESAAAEAAPYVAAPGETLREVEPSAGTHRAELPGEPWSIRETPDDPEPFWTDAAALGQGGGSVEGPAGFEDTGTDQWMFGRSEPTLDPVLQPPTRPVTPTVPDPAPAPAAVDPSGLPPWPTRSDDDPSDAADMGDIGDRRDSDDADDGATSSAGRSPWLTTEGETWSAPSPAPATEPLPVAADPIDDLPTGGTADTADTAEPTGSTTTDTGPISAPPVVTPTTVAPTDPEPQPEPQPDPWPPVDPTIAERVARAAERADDGSAATTWTPPVTAGELAARSGDPAPEAPGPDPTPRATEVTTSNRTPDRTPDRAAAEPDQVTTWSAVQAVPDDVPWTAGADDDVPTSIWSLETDRRPGVGDEPDGAEDSLPHSLLDQFLTEDTEDDPVDPDGAVATDDTGQAPGARGMLRRRWRSGD